MRTVIGWTEDDPSARVTSGSHGRFEAPNEGLEHHGK